ncbi:MAG: hypothetical protein KDD89_06355 [Anaerolineales bacterium]|nr:hypothetical protein [Anaerolineales bacterium]
MPTRARFFMIAYMTLGILGLLFTVQSLMNGLYVNALLTASVFLLCSWQVYRLLQQSRG